MKTELFLTTVNMIASKHNCKVVSIDFETETIKLEGSSDDELACATELGKILDDYLI